MLNIGNSYNYGIAAFDGIVSLYEQALLVDQFNKRVPVMQITAAVNEGSSGSPVLDVYGNVAGMGAYQILNDANSRAILDMNFAIPALIVSKITAGIISENPVGDKAAEEYNSLSLQLVKNSSEKFEIDFGTLGFKGIVADGKIKVTNVSGSFSSLAFGSGTLLEEGDEIVQFGYDDGALTGVFDIFASAENYEYTTGPQSAQRRFILKFMRGGKQFSVSYNNVYEKIIG